MADLDLTGYKLTFSDEFNTRSISATGAGTTWADMRSQWLMSDGKADVGFGISSFVDPSSGYDPFKVEGGALIITAAGDVTPSGFPGSMESGLITTQGNWSQKQGYFEMRADLSDAPHAWDAFWMAPDQQVNPGTPDAWQELDVVEHYGDNDKGVYSHIHTTDPSNGIPWQQNRQVYSELANKDGYHTYGVLWEADKLSFYVDGEFKGSQATPSDYSNPQYMMANLATQPGAVGGEQMKIDYIRAYSKDGSNPTVALGQVSAPDGHDPGMYGATALNSSAPPAVDHTTDVVVPPVTPPVVAADDSAPVTPPVVAADDSAPVTPPVVAADDSAPVTPPVVATDDIPPATPPVVAADNVPPAAPAVGAADDGLLADQANAAVGHHGHGSHGWHNDLHFDQMGLSADAAHGFDGGHQLAHMLADIISAHASVAFIQTMQTLEKNISNSDTAQGGHSQAWFDNDLLGNAATSDLAAMMDNAGDHQHQHFENATARQHQHFEHGWG